MQTHFALRSLSANGPDKDVQVLFSTRPNRKAVLFIHGFGGNPINTWSDFHELLPENPNCCHDMFFYGYDGLRAEMNASAAMFCDFLERFFTATNALLVAANLPSEAQRPAHFCYDQLIIVAHSLGAVITRRALLDATHSKLPWVTKTKMVLYAPAHKGAVVADLALEAASSFPFLRLFGIGARFASPLIDALKPNSASLTALLQETMAATQGGANAHLIASHVVIAEFEKIVSNDRFGNDPRPTAIPDATHTSICKPTRASLDPLRILERYL